MPQFDLLLMLVLLRLQILSGSVIPQESMTGLVQWIILSAPTTHSVMLAHAILYRGAGLSEVWPQFAALALIATALFAVFARAVSQDLGSDGMTRRLPQCAGDVESRASWNPLSACVREAP